MATKIFLKKDSNQSVATLPNWTSVADIFGAAAGNEVVNIHVASSDLSNFSSSAMNLDQNIEGVYLSQAITAYQFAANGNEVSIKLGGVTVAKVTVQDDTDGTQITYAGSNTPIALTLAAKTGGFDVKLGEQVLTSTAVAYGESSTPPNASGEQAPWTLVMQTIGTDSYYKKILVSNGTEGGTTQNDTDSYYSSAIQSSQDANASYYTKEVYDSTQSKYVYQLWTVTSNNNTPSKLADIDVSLDQFYLDNALTLGNYQLFTGSNHYNPQLLATDGTSAHTFSTSFSGNILQVDPTTNTIWHTMTTAPYGTELYKTTLSDAGFTTTMVKDIYAGSSSSSPSYSALTADGKLIFRANDGVTGDPEVFVSDGTEAGTFSLDLYKGSFNSYPSQLTAFNGKVAMSARTYDGTNYTGDELVINDGTTAGTKVLDVYAGNNSSYPTILGTVGTNLYFTATDATGLGLFKTDGTTFSKLVSISDSNAQLLGYTANKAYFALTTSANGKELWSVDLTATTPTLTLTKDILAGSGSGLVETYSTTMIGDKILFNAYTSGTNQAYFISDGTTAGTVQLAATLPTDKAVVGSKVFFANSTGVYSADTSVSTVSVAQVKAGDFSVSTNTYPLPDRLQSDSDQAFFVGGDKKFYVSTGSDAIQLASNVDKFKVVAENAIYFIETNSSNVSSLWYSDGTAAGTRYIEDLTLSASSYDLANAVAIHTVGISSSGQTISGVAVD